MIEYRQSISDASEEGLRAEIVRLNKIIQALMNRAERTASVQGSDFNLFHTAITLENQVRIRTEELKAALVENEKMNRALRESENRLRLIVENAPISIHEIDMEGRIISMNAAGLRMRGVNEESEVRGTFYLSIVSDRDRGRIKVFFDKAFSGDISRFEFKSQGPRERIFTSCLVPIRDKIDGVERLIGLTDDITEQKEAEEHIRRLAFYDALTQLPNRRLLYDRINQAKTLSKRTGRYNALMFIDLDNFKPLNDAYGHKVGDLLLIEVAHRLIACVREMDTVARLGGDEFVVLISELKGEKESATAQVRGVSEKIRASLALPYLLTLKHDGEAEIAMEHRCTSSIGVVVFVDHEAGQEDIIKWADMAMYQAKRQGKNTVHFFDGNCPE